jgi:hypothetical protein
MEAVTLFIVFFASACDAAAAFSSVASTGASVSAEDRIGMDNVVPRAICCNSLVSSVFNFHSVLDGSCYFVDYPTSSYFSRWFIIIATLSLAIPNLHGILS